VPDYCCFTIRKQAIIVAAVGATETRSIGSRMPQVQSLCGWCVSARPVGVLAYWNSEAVGWCSIAPRENYRALERFRALPRLDDKPVGSVICFFVDRHVRSQRVTLGLLNAAVEYARSQGAKIIEGYPMKPGPRLYTYIGSRSCF